MKVQIFSFQLHFHRNLVGELAVGGFGSNQAANLPTPNPISMIIGKRMYASHTRVNLLCTLWFSLLNF
jgi:hypothetical protein